VRWVKRLFLLAIAAGIAASIGLALMPQPVEVDIATIVRGPLQVTVNEDGVTRIREKYVVSSPLAGRLMRIDLRAGDEVVAGKTVLARMQPTDPTLLDPREIARANARVKAAEGRLEQTKAQLDRAKAALDFAESDQARVLKLAAGSAAAQDRVDATRLAFREKTEEYRVARFAEEIARYELELERAALLRTQPSEPNGESGDFLIHAPITGRVLRVFQESAAVVTAGASLLELGDPQDLEMVVDVLSTDAVKIVPGAAVSIEQWGGDQALKGTVRLVEPSGFTKLSALGVEEQRVNVIVDFNDPIEARRTLGDGFRIEARISEWESPDVLSVPTSAMFRDHGDWSVFVVDGTRAVQRTVKIGHSNGLQAEVLEGLNAGERVVVHPSDEVASGVEVRVRTNGAGGEGA
jgi:HlyD family secretion protein